MKSIQGSCNGATGQVITMLLVILITIETDCMNLGTHVVTRSIKPASLNPMSASCPQFQMVCNGKCSLQPKERNRANTGEPKERKRANTGEPSLTQSVLSDFINDHLSDLQTSVSVHSSHCELHSSWITLSLCRTQDHGFMYEKVSQVLHSDKCSLFLHNLIVMIVCLCP